MKKFNLNFYIYFLFAISNLVVFFFSINKFPVNNIIFVIYSFLVNYYVLFSFRNKALFFEKILSIFIWLGFWFKFNVVLNTSGLYREGVGDFDYSEKLYNFGLLVVIVALLTLILCSYIRAKLFTYEFYQKKIQEENHKDLIFYKKNKKKIYLIFIFTFILLAYLNYEFTIYRKGLISNENINFFILGIFKWLTIFGLCSISSFIIFYEIKLKKNIFQSLLVSVLEGFITNIGFMSRAMIFNQISLILGLNKSIKLNNNKFGFTNWIKYLIIVITFFVLSVYLVNIERQNTYWSGINKNIYNYDFEYNRFASVNEDPLQLQKHFFLRLEDKFFTNFPQIKEFSYLLINRWVGLDAVFTVVSEKDIGFEMLIGSFKEKFNPKKHSYYEMKFLDKNDYSFQVDKRNYGIILPGFIAFSFYSGSYLLMILIISLLYLVSASLEVLAFRLSNYNLVFSSLIGQVLAYRLIHFGYLPSQSYLLIGSIILNILLYYGIIKYIKNR